MPADLAAQALWPLLAVACLAWGGLLTFLLLVDQLSRVRARQVFKVWRNCTGLVAVLALAMMGAFSCAGHVESPAHVPREAVVVLECWHGDEQLPCCNAFAVRRLSGMRLLTAAHCLHGLSAHERAKYAMVNGPPWNEAEVLTVDLGRDSAELEPIDPVGLVALELGGNPDEGAVVRVLSAYSGWAELSGTIVAKGGDYYATTLDLRPGWSGSPVVDSYGRAVGIAVMCQGRDIGTKWCVPNTGRFVGVQ